MEEDQRSGHEKKKRIRINLGKEGKAIGAGIMLVGGALTIAALVANTFQKNLSRPSTKKNTDNKDQSSTAGNHDTPADKSFQRKDPEETNELQSDLPADSSLHVHPNLICDGTEKRRYPGDGVTSFQGGIDSGSKETRNMSEYQGILDQDYNHVRHRMASENTLPKENEKNMSSSASSIPPQLKPVMGLEKDTEESTTDLNSSEIEDEKGAIEPAVEEIDDHNSLVQSTMKETEKALQEFQDMSPTSGAAEIITEDYPVTPNTEENSDGRSQADIFDEGEDSSEGSVDSSVGSTTEPVWPADSVQEVLLQFSKQIAVIRDHQERPQEKGEGDTLKTTAKEGHSEKIDGDISSKSLQLVNAEKGNSNMTSVNKYLVRLAEQNDKQVSLFLKQRRPALMGTLPVLFWPLLFWYYGLRFLKGCLMIVLLIVISQIQGF